MPDDERQIRQLVADWMAASKAGDSAKVLSLMTDDVVFLRAAHPPMIGKDRFPAEMTPPPNSPPPQVAGSAEEQLPRGHARPVPELEKRIHRQAINVARNAGNGQLAAIALLEHDTRRSRGEFRLRERDRIVATAERTFEAGKRIGVRGLDDRLELLEKGPDRRVVVKILSGFRLCGWRIRCLRRQDDGRAQRSEAAGEGRRGETGPEQRAPCHISE